MSSCQISIGQKGSTEEEVTVRWYAGAGGRAEQEHELLAADELN